MAEIREQIDFMRVSSAGKFDEMADTMEKLLAVYEAMNGLLSESSGVDGYHLNGDIASWDELGIPELLGAVKTTEQNDG